MLVSIISSFLHALSRAPCVFFPVLASFVDTAVYTYIILAVQFYLCCFTFSCANFQLDILIPHALHRVSSLLLVSSLPS